MPEDVQEKSRMLINEDGNSWKLPEIVIKKQNILWTIIIFSSAQGCVEKQRMKEDGNSWKIP